MAIASQRDRTIMVFQSTRVVDKMIILLPVTNISHNEKINIQQQAKIKKQIVRKEAGDVHDKCTSTISYIPVYNVTTGSILSKYCACHFWSHVHVHVPPCIQLIHTDLVMSTLSTS